QLTERLRTSEQVAIQLDGTTDVGNAAQLLVYVCYVWLGEILEEFLFQYTTILEVSDETVAFWKKADCVRDTIVAHLSTLAEYFSIYFKNRNMEEYDWDRDPFSTFALSSFRLSGRAEEELLEMSCDRTLKIKFQEQAPYQFWPTVATEYPVLVTEAMKVVLPFPTTYSIYVRHHSLL
ncbi:ZBED5 protein, partial [Polyodon spathula]|nr:ZBED5 protein [Polyodon spathula]